MTAYYNEFNQATAAWLRELIRVGVVAPGVVDERSIEDVRPSDLRGFKQCHFFAGIGVWSYALRAAGWPDDRPVWTGSCPCQPFSAAGKGLAFADERHLWPAFYHLIGERRPPTILGEQVASAAVDDWIDLVHADLEALDYSFGSVPFPSAGVGAPHIRDRNYWVAHADRQRRVGEHALLRAATKPRGSGKEEVLEVAGRRQARRLGDAERDGLRSSRREAANITDQSVNREVSGATVAAPGPVNGFWRDADWLACRDGKWRPIEPGTQPLVNGPTTWLGRMRLRGYGNAVNAEAARAWIETVMECIA